MKRVTEMKERKKLDASGVEVHQTMMAIFEDRYGNMGFGQGFESSESLTVRSSSDSESSEEGRKRFFEDVMRMKDHVSFDSSLNYVNFSAVVEEDRTLSQSRKATASRIDRSVKNPPEKVKLTLQLLKTHQTQDFKDEKGSVVSSVEPIE